MTKKEKFKYLVGYKLDGDWTVFGFNNIDEAYDGLKRADAVGIMAFLATDYSCVFPNGGTGNGKPKKGGETFNH